MRPFNLEEAKAGKPVCTIEGKPVRILCWDRKDPIYPIIALVIEGDREVMYDYNYAGKLMFGSDTLNDLMMADE